MCNGYAFKKWQLKALESLINSYNINLDLLIINDTSENHDLRFIKKIFRYHYRILFYRLYKKYFFRSDAESEVDQYDDLKDTPFILSKVVKKGKSSEYFSEKDIKTIKEYNLDFIIRFGFNIIRGEILNSAKYGVWSYHHDDELIYRGGPHGFWEIYRNDNINAVILQKLSDKLDAGIILKKGYFKTIKHSYSANVDNILYGASDWIKQVCIDIQSGHENNFNTFVLNSTPSGTKAKILTVPSNLQMFVFIILQFIHKLKFHYNELFKAEQWNIGVINKPVTALMDDDVLPEINWLHRIPRRIFRADSFGFFKNNKLNVLFEDWNYKTRKGNISKIIYEVASAKHYPMLSLPVHLAYPYTFKVENELYCVPETSADNKINLYKLSANADKLDFVKTLIDNIDAIDSTIFFFNGLWWLFCTRKQFDSNTCLFVYFSETFDGVYEPHHNNPVKTDISSARPAGILLCIKVIFIVPHRIALKLMVVLLN